MSFIRRLAKRHDALTKPSNQLYILARRGQLKRFSGPLLEPVRFSLPLHNQPNEHSFINVEADFASSALKRNKESIALATKPFTFMLESISLVPLCCYL